MTTIPSAKEFVELYNKDNNTQYSVYDVNFDFMIMFAKFHVQAQKEIIKQKLEEHLMNTFAISLTDDIALETTGNSIIDNAYPLTNIK